MKIEQNHYINETFTSATTISGTSIDISYWDYVSIYTHIGTLTATPNFEYSVYVQPLGKNNEKWFYNTTKSFSTTYASGSASPATFYQELGYVAGQNMRLDYTVSSAGSTAFSMPVDIYIVGRRK